MGPNANIRAVITADDRASATLKNFGNNVNHMAKNASIAIAAAGAAAVAFGVASVKAFSESENVISQTNAVIKSTGGVAGVSAKQVGELASSLQKVTKFSDETIQSGQNLLLTFTNISKDIFPEATETMLNMSEALGQDVKSSAIQLGKALQDPILGVTALRRVGVNFNDSQRDVIKNLVETGRAAEAQKMILKELQVEFGGSARAAGETFAGKLAILKNNLNDVQESIGKSIVDALTPFAQKLAAFVETDRFKKWVQDLTTWIQVNLPKAINWMVTQGIPAVKNILELTWPVVQTLWNMFSGLVNFLSSHEYVFWGLVAVFGAIKTAMFLEGALSAFKGVMAGATTAFQGLKTLVMTPMVMPAIAVAAALAALGLVIAKIAEVRQSIAEIEADTKRAVDSNINSINQLKELAKSSDPAVRARAQKALEGSRARGFATGTNFAPGGTALVGEQGPELVNLPRGSQVVPNHKLNGVANNVNITFNGIFTGNEMEFRKLAVKLNSALQDAQGMGTA